MIFEIDFFYLKNEILDVFLMFFYFFLFFSLFFVDIFLKNNILYYSGVIELYIRPDKKELQSDLNFLKEYIKNQKNDSTQPQIIDQISTKKEGFDLYKKNDEYKDLYYVLAEKILTQSLTGIAGVYAFYRGYDEMSDSNGRILFPRFDEKNEISLLLTSEISPVVLKGAIPDHFIIFKDIPYVFYLYKGILDEKTNVITWKIEQSKDILTSQKIPYNTITIMINPDFVYFDTLPVITQASNNIILPILYLINKKEDNYSQFALNVLQYYKPFSEKKYTTTIDSQIHRAVSLKDHI